MNLYIKQHVFSWGDKFSIYGADGNVCYQVEGEIFTWGKKLHLLDQVGNELAFIRQKVMSFLPKYYISRNGVDIAEVVKEFTFFHPEYTVNGLDWTVKGDIFDHEYGIYAGNQQLASVSKVWLSWGDTYELRTAPGVDVVNALAVVLVIDACISTDN